MGQQRGVLVFLLLLSFLILACGADSGARPAPAEDVSSEALAQAIVQATRAAATKEAAQAIFARATIEAAKTATAVYLQERAAQATATAQAQATRQAVEATQQAAVFAATQAAMGAQATATAQAVQANATATAQAAQTTATAQAQSAQAAQVAADATATVIAAQVRAAEEKAEWDRRMESGRAIGSFLLGGLALMGLVLLLGWAAIKFVDAGVLRARVMRDRTGLPILIMPPDEEGRQQVLLPTRSPGPVITITPPGLEPPQVETPAADPDTTRRDQAVSLMIAAASTGGKNPQSLPGDESDRVQIVSTPPERLLPSPAREAIDADWKRAEGDGGGT